MFTKKEKKLLTDLINTVPIQGNLQSIPKFMEELNALSRKIAALPEEEGTEPQGDGLAAKVQEIADGLGKRRKRH